MRERLRRHVQRVPDLHDQQLLVRLLADGLVPHRVPLRQQRGELWLRVRHGGAELRPGLRRRSLDVLVHLQGRLRRVWAEPDVQPLGLLVWRWHQLTRKLALGLLMMACGRTELVGFVPVDAGVIDRCAAGFADVDGVEVHAEVVFFRVIPPVPTTTSDAIAFGRDLDDSMVRWNTCPGGTMVACVVAPTATGDTVITGIPWSH